MRRERKEHEIIRDLTDVNVTLVEHVDSDTSVSITYWNISSLCYERRLISIEIVDDNIAKLCGDT